MEIMLILQTFSAAQPAPQPQPGDEAGENEAGAGGDEATPEDSPGPAAEATQQPQPEAAWYDVAATFVTTFFTSIVPDQNDPQVFWVQEEEEIQLVRDMSRAYSIPSIINRTVFNWATYPFCEQCDELQLWSPQDVYNLFLDILL